MQTLLSHSTIQYTVTYRRMLSDLLIDEALTSNKRNMKEILLCLQDRVEDQ